MPDAVRVKNYREVMRALAVADKQVRVGFRKELRDVAEPVRRDAESLTTQEIGRVTVPWSKMRVGVTRKAVYVAPKERGVKRGDPRSRPKFGTRLIREAMEPALDQNQHEVYERVERMLDRVADGFN